jgi:hypothetical protein
MNTDLQLIAKMTAQLSQPTAIAYIHHPPTYLQKLTTGNNTGKKILHILPQQWRHEPHIHLTYHNHIEHYTSDHIDFSAYLHEATWTSNDITYEKLWQGSAENLPSETTTNIPTQPNRLFQSINEA